MTITLVLLGAVGGFLLGYAARGLRVRSPHQHAPKYGVETTAGTAATTARLTFFISPLVIESPPTNQHVPTREGCDGCAGRVPGDGTPLNQDHAGGPACKRCGRRLK